MKNAGFGMAFWRAIFQATGGVRLKTVTFKKLPRIPDQNRSVKSPDLKESSKAA
jgi:hypothetical protein